MNDQIDIGYIDHFDETFDYSYADEDIAYKQIYEMHHCVSIPEETFSLWGEISIRIAHLFLLCKTSGDGGGRLWCHVDSAHLPSAVSFSDASVA
mgnify:CR=1 FL=1